MAQTMEFREPQQGHRAVFKKPPFESPARGAFALSKHRKHVIKKKSGTPDDVAPWVIIKTRCTGKLHEIAWHERGRVVFLDHSAKDMRALKTLQKLGDNTCGCLKVLDEIRKSLKSWTASALPKAFKPLAVAAIECKKERAYHSLHGKNEHPTEWGEGQRMFPKLRDPERTTAHRGMRVSQADILKDMHRRSDLSEDVRASLGKATLFGVKLDVYEDISVFVGDPGRFSDDPEHRDYASVAWVPSWDYHINKLTGVKPTLTVVVSHRARRAVRIMRGAPAVTSYGHAVPIECLGHIETRDGYKRGKFRCIVSTGARAADDNFAIEDARVKIVTLELAKKDDDDISPQWYEPIMNPEVRLA